MTGRGTPQPPIDVLVVGTGNAGFAAALAAAEQGARVVILETGSADEIGGNSYYTAGATRITHGGLVDLLDLVEPDSRHSVTSVPPYSPADFAADMAKVTEGRNAPVLTEVLISDSRETLQWLKGMGLKYRLMYERQAYERSDGSYLFWGGLHVGNVDGGKGLVRDYLAASARFGIDINCDMHVYALLREGGAIVGVQARRSDGATVDVRAGSVVLAAGGFEASRERRRDYLGERWERAKVRGTRHNTDDGLQAALDVGARRAGDWSTCHSVAWDAEAEDNESNPEFTNRFTRQSYPLGIVVNREGRRFIDEGADFRNYTYAKYGKNILAQPGGIAYQLFDADLYPLLRVEEYEMPGASVYEADSIPELAARIGVEPTALTKTVDELNASIDRGKPFDPTIKDGRQADVAPPKSNWANALERAPFYAYPVTCGITFTFGGIEADVDGRVIDETGAHIKGLFVAGEMLGGLFSANYPGGTGLAAGAVFGCRAGRAAASQSHGAVQVVEASRSRG